MENFGNILFTEKEYMRQKWLIMLILIPCGFAVLVFLYALYVQLIHGVPYGQKPMSSNSLMVSGFLSLFFGVGIPVLLLRSNLQLIVTTEAIYYRYFPFLMKFKKIPYLSIIKYEVREYNPVKDFGGWGIKWSSKYKTIAYTVSGNKGLFLQLSTGKNILLGTYKPAELEEALHRAMGK